MKHGSLFSGVGGFDLAAQWMGWDNVFHCEWNEFGQKVLKHYWPKAETFTDITKSDFTKYANTIDILTGGFPCQPYSLAGKRKGKEDERHLWPEMLRAIREIRPRWVVGENVFGLVNWSGGLVFHEVQADLEAAGYEVWPYVLPACAKNAPHRRDRIWFVAHCDGLSEKQPKQEVGGFWRKFTSCSNANATNTNSRCSETFGQRSLLEQSESEGEASGHSFGSYRNDWTSWPTQSPLCNGDDGLSTGLDTNTISFSKWRNESIKAGGNAIVPQVAYELFKAIEQYELLFNSTPNPEECDASKSQSRPGSR